MPIVDGLTSTKMIRSFEKSDDHPPLSAVAQHDEKIPIFAVSASLVEKEKTTYVEAGFDGWILKPIDFKRLNTLLEGIRNEDTRNECIYVPGEWERGGWFNARTTSLTTSIVAGDQLPLVANPASSLLGEGGEPTQEST